MIKPLFHIILSLILIIVQTVVLPGFPFFSHAFDLVIVNVLYLSLIFVHRAVLFWVLFLGCVMDSVSGTPFGLHLLAYLWIYVLIQLLKRYVHYGNVIFIPVISAVAVLIENLFLVFSLLINQGLGHLPEIDIALMALQVFWAFWLIPILIVVIHSLQGNMMFLIHQGDERRRRR